MKKYFILFFIFFAHLLSAQEIISNLISNPFLFNNPFVSTSTKSVLTLPFFDDFSYDASIVNSELWEQSSVFVNRSYPLNPPTIGVATFDGLDEFGLARDFNQPSNADPSDTLLSKPINLSVFPSVYFMFYYQAKGLGDAPELQDKLVLEFYNDTLGWEQVWLSQDTILEEFKKVVIVIDDSRFLHDAFQFRFRNYATISGNFDHYHLDYVKIDELLSATDTIELNDVSFVYSSPSFLKRYSEMPWTHFLNNEALELKDSVDIKIRNNDASVNVDYQYNVFENNNLIFHYPLIGVSRNVTVLDYDIIGNYSFSNPPLSVQSNAFSSFQSENATFLIQNIIGTSASDNKLNDTLYHIQNFHSHFSYDDGTAESAYGINVNGAKLAYEFKLNRPDTLRAVQMYFPQMLESVNHIDFNLTIWEKINGLPGDTLYSQTVSPVHTENGLYHNYYLDRPFKIVGDFYVGWEQTTDDLLNIGLDKNNQANSYMFYNVGAGWTMSSYPGSWMIRPVLSMDEIVSDVTVLEHEIRVYPSPAISQLFVKTSALNNVISIYSLQGVLLTQVNSDSNFKIIDINDLSSGVYLVEILNYKGKHYQKIIVK
ncbi:MAG: T9SS type A sorting domain-containing protein [Bacteroidota bacterium]|nr:T9SS type A sorting domain-containing protein [Bacteroidota bacterium]